MKKIFKKTVVAILEFEAKLALKRYKPKIVAVTGSVGKTSTKDAIYTVLASQFFTRKSEKSFNSEIGVPLTVLGLQNGWNNPFAWLGNIFKGAWLVIRPAGLTGISSNGLAKKRRYPEWLVLEVGADRPGDIQHTASWMKPDIAVMTRIGAMPVHVEFFKSQAELVKEKSYLARALKPGGVLVLDGDDKDVVAFREFANGGRIIFVRLERDGEQANGADGESADSAPNLPAADTLVGSHEQIYYEKNTVDGEFAAGVTFKVNFQGNSVPVVRKGVVGLQHIYPTLYALAVGISQGLNIVPMSEALSSEVLTPGRMRLLAGDKAGSLIIDDTYNSSPVALHEAIKTLGQMRAGRAGGKKIAALGDMLELGKHSVEEHEKAGRAVAKILHGADVLVTVGMRARSIADGALDGGMNELKVMQFDYAAEGGDYVDSIFAEGDIALVKGSQGIRMERVVERIMAEPSRRAELLVRQDDEWKGR